MHTIFIHQPYLDDDPIIIETTPELLYELKIEKLISNNSYIGISNCNLNELNKIYLVDYKNNEYFSDVEIFELSLEIEFDVVELTYDDYEPSTHKYSSEFVYSHLNKPTQEQVDIYEKLKDLNDRLGNEIPFEKIEDNTHIFLKVNVMTEFNKYYQTDIIYNLDGTINIYNGEEYDNAKLYEIENLYFNELNYSMFYPVIYNFKNNIKNIIFSESNLHKRTVDTLNNAGFIDTNSLTKISKYNLFRIPKLGKSSIKNIISLCEENDIHFMEETLLHTIDEYKIMAEIFYPDFSEE